MDDASSQTGDGAPAPVGPGSLLRAPETGRTIFLVTAAATMGPLAAGVVFFGYRAAMVAVLSIGGCVAINWAQLRLTRTAAPLDHSHAALTGALLALTLPPFVAWYVPLVAAAFAVIIGKGIFGGVGHFPWQPALVGRLAVSAMFALAPTTWPVLSPTNVITGDVRSCKAPAVYRGWSHAKDLPEGADGFLLRRPAATLRDLYDKTAPRYTSVTEALLDLPEIRELLCGMTGGGIGETSAIVLVVAGLYLIYRHYVNWLLPASFIISAAVVVAVAPVHLAGPGDTGRTVWLPLTSEGLDVGFTFLSYHLTSGELLLAALFLAPEMTRRPVTRAGQVLFGAGCGVIGMLLRLYVVFPLACYMAVMAMNTTTPALERITRPLVLGQRPWWVRMVHRRRR